MDHRCHDYAQEYLDHGTRKAEASIQQPASRGDKLRLVLLQRAAFALQFLPCRRSLLADKR